jgi:hypothetical protein
MTFDTKIQPRVTISSGFSDAKASPYVAPSTNAVNNTVFDVNTVWVFRSGNQYPVIIRSITNNVDTQSYPRMITFETVKGEMLTLPANTFNSSLTKTEFKAMKFAAIKNALKDII